MVFHYYYLFLKEWDSVIGVIIASMYQKEIKESTVECKERQLR